MRKRRLLLFVWNLLGMVVAEAQVPCFFIFGDSLSDSGNNSNLVTSARANYPPYGIDFPGGNDYINNYFLPAFYPTSRLYSPQQYATLLIQQYKEQFKIMYNYGARKVALIGLLDVGCIPRELAHSNGTCNSSINSVVGLFNAKLPSLVDSFNTDLYGAKFMFVNISAISNDIERNLQAYGFMVTNTGCCRVDRSTGEEKCLPFGIPCQNRSQHIFWDDVHPTEALHLIYARGMYNGSSSSTYTYPVDIQGLAQQ
ncbi:hypothetical protein MRB53_020038 [Persea americana]|uniref:Uncharacterized protein n=1 Tax=Persea americana TaxID=3435 RepID=A0ACC2L008_PERAE|nr:hypothetical protein MRB53_020038 [Persea americana]